MWLSAEIWCRTRKQQWCKCKIRKEKSLCIHNEAGAPQRKSGRQFCFRALKWARQCKSCPPASLTDTSGILPASNALQFLASDLGPQVSMEGGRSNVINESATEMETDTLNPTDISWFLLAATTFELFSPPLILQPSLNNISQLNILNQFLEQRTRCRESGICRKAAQCVVYV